MAIFFLMMLAGMMGIMYLVYKDVPTAPWNKWFGGRREKS
jgi:hypothetical protein